MSIIICIFTYLLIVFSKRIHAGFTTTKIGPTPIWNSTYTDQLRHDLLLNYDKFARPTQHFNTTTVQFGLTIKHLELNEFKSTLTVHAWLHLRWSDEKLKWNSSNYGGLSSLNLAEHEIWQPDIFLYNGATTSPVSHYGNIHCVVYQNGEVLWVPPAMFTVFCNVNMRYWPFDKQTCELILGSWTYNGNQIDIEVTDDKANVELLVTSFEWQIIKTTLRRNEKFYTCCPEPYVDATIGVVLSRISPSYRALIITPAFVIIILILLNFWLPPQAGEKIILNSCAAIMICLFMLYFTQKIPAMGTHTPLVVLFYSSCLYMVAFSMISSVIVIWLSKTKHTTPLPWIIKHPLTGTMGKLLGLTTYIQQTTLTSQTITAEEMRDHQLSDFDDHHHQQNDDDDHHMIRSSSSTSSKISLQQDWILFAAAIDRLSFCFFCFLFIILSIVYSL